MEIITFMLGLFLAAFFTGAIGAVCWQRERAIRIRCEAYNRINNTKLDRLEKLHAQVEAKIREKDELLARSKQQLEQCGHTISMASQRIHQLETALSAQKIINLGHQALEGDNDITGLN